jgi:hypothetical protein
LTCIAHAAHLIAHSDATENAGVEHRDISAGNILIIRKEDGTAVGYLIDWELAKYEDEEYSRAYERTVCACFTMDLLPHPDIH